jgi:hypothetical protein
MIDAGYDNFTLATLGPDGELPATRIGSANTAWNIADQLARDNVGREQKRIRIFKSYNRFPPTEYSKMAQKALPFSSNVNWGQMEFIINNQKSSYTDIITERQACAEIKTKYGNEKERLVHSENITKAFDHALREWPGYLYNKEQDVQSMLLYGKGIGMWTSPFGWMPEAVPLSDLLFPSNVKIDFSNLEEFVRRVRLTPYQLYKVIKDREAAESLGWNVDAVIDAIRFQRSFLETNKTREEFYRTLSEASFNWNLSVNQTIDLYEIYWQEFDGTISKAVVLQDYTPIVSNIKSTLRGADKITDAEVRDQHGFMQLNIGLFDNWDQILYMVTDSVGSGLFHDIKSQAEACFVAARQYDFTMNSLVDAVRLNSMLLLEGQGPDSTKTLKQMEWLPMSIMPDGAKFTQNRITLPVQESMQFMQFYMGDLYRGMGQYRINAPTNRGGQRTRGEAELDAAESAKLSGTQIRRFNECETLYFRELYRRFVSSTRNDDGYHYVKRFHEMLEELGTPKEAAAFKNILSIRSNLINGAGSPSFKLITAEKLVNLTSITPANEGQENAVKDAIAALAGRDNVERYRNTKAPKIGDTERIIGFENAGMTDVFREPRQLPGAPHRSSHRARGWSLPRLNVADANELAGDTSWSTRHQRTRQGCPLYPVQGRAHHGACRVHRQGRNQGRLPQAVHARHGRSRQDGRPDRRGLPRDGTSPAARGWTRHERRGTSSSNTSPPSLVSRSTPSRSSQTSRLAKPHSATLKGQSNARSKESHNSPCKKPKPAPRFKRKWQKPVWRKGKK